MSFQRLKLQVEYVNI